MGKAKKEPSKDKSFCLVCGTELDLDSKYCKECAAPIEEEPQDKHVKAKRSRARIIVVLMVIIIVIASISIFFFINYEDVNELKTYEYSPTTAPAALTVDLDMDSGSMVVNFTSDPEEPVVKIDYFKRWTGMVVERPRFSTSMAKVKFNGATVIGSADSEIEVTLRADVKYTIKAKTTSGSFIMDTNVKGISFDSITTDSTSGSAVLNLKDASISGKIKTTGTSGSVSSKMIEIVSLYVDLF